MILYVFRTPQALTAALQIPDAQGLDKLPQYLTCLIKLLAIQAPPAVKAVAQHELHGSLHFIALQGVK